MSRVCIVGIGSGLGPDQAGWLALEHLKRCRWLQDKEGDAVSLHECALPTDLPNLLAGTDIAILIDAVIGAPGTLQIIDGDQLAADTDCLSTHGLGIRQALDLLRALGKQPRRVILYGLGSGESEEILHTQSMGNLPDPRAMRDPEQHLRGLLSQGFCDTVPGP